MPRTIMSLLLLLAMVMAISCAARSAPPISASLPPQAYFDALE